MAYKPRRKQLTPEKARTKLAAEEAQWLQKQERLDLRVKRERELAALFLPMLTKLHAGVQEAADANPAYRPLAGKDWYETLNLFGAHPKTLTGSNRSGLLTKALQDVGMWDVENLTSVLMLVKIAREE